MRPSYRAVLASVLLLGTAVSVSTAASAQSVAERADRMLRSLERAPTPTSTSTSTLTTAATAAAHMTVADEMARLHVTGASVALVVDGKVAWVRAYGSKEAGKPAPVDSTTLFLAGSISKPVFASGAMALVDKGTLSLDANINDALKSWKLPDSRFTEKEKVTLRRLLSHSAGLTVWGFPGYEVGKPVPTVPQLLDSVPPSNTGAVRNDTTPGARWLYSGGGITVAQLAATDVTGESFVALMQRLVLAPMGMKRSTYENPIPAARAAETATGHEKPDTAVAGRWHVYPEMAAAGLWTTPSDLARWGIGMMRSYRGERGGLLSSAMAREMLRPQVRLPTTGPLARPNVGWWGLGAEVGGSGRDFNFSHGGRDEGFVATMVFYPERNVGLVVMTNATNSAFLNELTRAFVAEFVK